MSVLLKSMHFSNLIFQEMHPEFEQTRKKRMNQWQKTSNWSRRYVYDSAKLFFSFLLFLLLLELRTRNRSSWDEFQQIFLKMTDGIDDGLLELDVSFFTFWNAWKGWKMRFYVFAFWNVWKCEKINLLRYATKINFSALSHIRKTRKLF